MSKKKFKRLFLKLEVHDNRVEVTQGMIPFRRKNVIPLRSISHVEVTGLTKSLVIHTNDGDNLKYSLAGLLDPFGRRASKARDAIVERMT